MNHNGHRYPNRSAQKRALSCIQPTGIPTLGNYLGAMRNWVNMQDDFECAFAVADLHAITVRQDAAQFRRQIYEMFSLLLAIGLDPEKSLLFVQSQVPAHSEMAWLLACPVRRAVEAWLRMINQSR